MIVDLLSRNGKNITQNKRHKHVCFGGKTKEKMRFFKKLVIGRELIFVNYCLFIAVYQWHFANVIRHTVVYEATGKR